MANKRTKRLVNEMDVVAAYQQGDSMSAIIKEFKITFHRLKEILAKSGVAARTSTVHLKGNSHNLRCPVDKAMLEKMYVQEEKSIQEIQRITGLKNVYYYLVKHGIPRRGHSAHLKGKPSIISEEGRKRILYAISGPNNPNWRGGVVPENAKYYQSRKWRDLAKSCKERDGLACQSCQKEMLLSKLRAHHKKARRDGGSDILENLVTLCNSCHLKVENGSLPCP